MNQLLRNLRVVATEVRAGGGTISFEWPRHCSLWKEQPVRDFIEEFQLRKVDFDGCAVGLVPTKGEPLLKPWRSFTDNRSLLTALIDQRCNKQHQHGVIAGSETARTACYPPPLCILLHSSMVKAERMVTTSPPSTFEELAAASRRHEGEVKVEAHATSSLLIEPPPGLSLPAGPPLSLGPRPMTEPLTGSLRSHPSPFENDLVLNDLARTLDHPVLCGIDPNVGESGSSVGDAGFVAARAHTSSINSPSLQDAGHRHKATRPTIPHWCGLLTRVIKAGTEEFKSLPCQDAQKEEKRKLDAQSTWDYETVREWSNIRSCHLSTSDAAYR